MKKVFSLMLLLLSMVAAFTSCKSDTDKVRETAETYLFKNMKNPESLKIISCEVRKDTVPFYLSEELLDLADKYYEAIEEYHRYKDRSYLWIDEQLESITKVREAKEALQTAYKSAQENDSVDVEYIAYSFH